VSDSTTTTSSRPADASRRDSRLTRFLDAARTPQGLATLAASVLVGAITAAIVLGALLQDLAADYPLHMQMTRSSVQSGTFPGNPGFYFMNALLAGFSTDDKLLRGSLLLLLSVAAAFKAWASISVIGGELREDEVDGAAAARPGDRRPLLAFVAAVLVTFAFSFHFGDQNHYLGQIPANVWHNSTVVFLMPFAVALFALAVRYLRTGDAGLVKWIVVLSVANVLVKPSLMFCFIPVFPIAALLRFGWGTPPFWRAIGITVAAGAAVLAQYLYIYVAKPEGTGMQNDGSVALGPLDVWHAYTKSIPLALLASYVFPLVAVVVGGRRVLGNLGVQLALAMALVGVVEFALLKETGSRQFDGNFLWQAIVTTYLLFLALVAATTRWVRATGWSWRNGLITLAFLAHVVAGFLYLYGWFDTKSFT
jgi:hypothetical protein